MSINTNEIERDLVAGIRLLREFVEAGSDEAARILERVQVILFEPIEVEPGTIPHRDIEWQEKRAGRGGRRSTEDYRDLAQGFGVTLHPKIGWAQARDAARALEAAKARVDADHINLLLWDGGL